MAWLLASTSIRRPDSLQVENSTQVAKQRTLKGTNNRDHMGDNKRTWRLTYRNVNKTAFDIINAIYLSYLSTSAAQTWQVTETNYTISQTNVHVDLLVRNFRVKGTSYLSDFTLILEEV